MTRVKRLVNYICVYPLYLLSKVVPKKKNLWVFGSWYGRAYSDNSKYLFEYVSNNKPNIKAVWLTNDAQTAKIVKGKGFLCKKMFSLSGIYLSLRAAVGVVSRAKQEDLPLYICPYKTYIVQLWHGIPLKKLGNDKSNRVDSSKVKTTLKRILLSNSMNNYKLFISSSAEVSSIFSSAYGTEMQSQALRVTGFPRNDSLYLKGDLQTKRRNSNKLRKGIYMPTFRDWHKDSGFLFYNYGFDIVTAETVLRKYNAQLFIRLHPEAKLGKHLLDQFKKSDFIRFDDSADIYETITEFDFLITDYSSIFFDYLVIDRPIIFTPFDKSDYLNGRGLYFDYDDITPGMKANNWSQVFDNLAQILSGNDEYVERRQMIKRRLIDNVDANNCARVCCEIEALFKQV